ncbi:hypothetical protein KHQ88_04705 [Mycoplasmatota bacterium]|nr:hypothetical protein KHQ88_04705 [Mycoplasmatota bacterium]
MFINKHKDSNSTHELGSYLFKESDIIERTKETIRLHKRNFVKYGLDLNIFVSVVSAIFVLSFILITVIFPDFTANMFNQAKTWVTTNLTLGLSSLLT